jgi:UDP-N-acetylglucosamine/UDP-N-acetylgalactosamine diphosphorylase
MNETLFIKNLRKYDQGHIIEHFLSLDRVEQKWFLNYSTGLDLGTIFKMHREFSRNHKPQKHVFKEYKGIVVSLPDTAAQVKSRQKAFLLGQRLLLQEKIAVLVVSGGQGSRLDWNAPKGTFPITPIKKKSLFQLFAEKVKAVSIRYKTSIQFILILNQDDVDKVKDFFKYHGFFGLNPESVYFVPQNTLPAITAEGKLLLKDRLHLFTSPDGHGGTLFALQKYSIIDMLLEKGISDIFYCQIDNPLIVMADPVFVGYHAMTGSDISTKVIRRADPEEKVGIFMSCDGKSSVVEYSDLDRQQRSILDRQGRIRDWAGNTGIHLISLRFLSEMINEGIDLPYHRAAKKAKMFISAENIRNVDTWKFEKFIFDLIPLAKKSCCVEVKREEEFAPLKNKEGQNSPPAVKRALNDLYKNWLFESGMRVSDDFEIEISPLFALDKKEFLEKARDKKIPPLKSPLYLG